MCLYDLLAYSRFIEHRNIASNFNRKYRKIANLRTLSDVHCPLDRENFHTNLTVIGNCYRYPTISLLSRNLHRKWARTEFKSLLLFFLRHTLDRVKGHFGSLFQALHLQKTPLGKTNSFDDYCPSLIRKGLLKKRSCPHCGLYHSTIKAMIAHKRVCHANPRRRNYEPDLVEEAVDEDDLVEVDLVEDDLVEDEIIVATSIVGQNIFDRISHMFGTTS